MNKSLLVLTAIIMLVGCKKTDAPTAAETENSVTVTDAQLYLMATTSFKAAFFKNSSDTIPGNSGGAHAGNIVVWYNSIAKQELDVQGKVKSSASFADSSLIVKEIFNPAGGRLFYAIMFKRTAASNKGAGDWIWAELQADGTPLISAKDKGAGCSGCHSAGVSYTRMNDSHP